MSEFGNLLARKKEGLLKVYLGYAAGVGKTYAMLQEAQRLLHEGLDVVIGYLESHARPETEKQAEGLEVIAPLLVSEGGGRFAELDVEAVLRRDPQIVLVDELAHTNARGSKNDKRYKDVLEILAAGINVISTLNVQHLESIAERVQIGTGIPVRERLPDAVLSRADQVVNIDITKEDLRERLRQGKVYPMQQAERALVNFFTYSHLSFLRELTLRTASGHQTVEIETDQLLSKEASGEAVEAVMVALSSRPTNARALIQAGIRLANQMGSHCYVVYVRLPSESPLRVDAGVQRNLQHNMEYALEQGAIDIQLEGDNIPETLANFASENNVRHVVFGKSRLSPLRERLRGSFILEFLSESVGVDVHIINLSPHDVE